MPSHICSTDLKYSNSNLLLNIQNMKKENLNIKENKLMNDN